MNRNVYKNPGKKRILIVEDESIIALDIINILRQQGFEASGPVSTGEEAIQKASSEIPDLILMDIILAGRMNGIEAAREIRRACDIPIIYMTANADESSIILARDTEPYAYLNKPLNDRDLFSNIDTALYKHRTAGIIKERERTLATLIGNLPGIAYRCSNDRSWTMEFISNGCYELTGYLAEELIGNHVLSFNDLIHEDDRQPVWNTIQESIKNNETFRLEYRIKTAGGDIKWVWEQGCGVFSADKKLLALEGFITDITERKGAEHTIQRQNKELAAANLELSAAMEELEATNEEFEVLNEELTQTNRQMMNKEEILLLNEARLKALLDLYRKQDAPLKELMDFVLEQAVYLTRSRIGYLAFVSADEKTLSMYSWSRTAMEECMVRDKPIEYPLETTGLWGEAVRQRKPVITNDYSSSNPLKKGCPEGHVPLARHMNVPVFDGEKIVIVAGVGNKAAPYDDSDVRQLTLLMDGLWRLIHRKYASDEKHMLEEQVRHAQRMESLGRLAGGVAHDFNNMLTLIAGNISLALSMLKPGDSLRDTLRAAERASDSAMLLTQRLMAFSRKQVIEPAIIDINEMLADLGPILTRIAGTDIRVNMKTMAGLWPVKIDQGQLEQIIINIVMNARDAMESGGELSIETSNAEITEQDCAARMDFRAGPHVMLHVQDTGCGMSDEVKRHLFEPFFTTKPPGKGTGLGLATVYGSVKQNGGFIEVLSEPGTGSTFRIYLPKDQEINS